MSLAQKEIKETRKPRYKTKRKPKAERRDRDCASSLVAPLVRYFNQTENYKTMALKNALQLPSNLPNDDLASVVKATPLNHFVLAANGCRIISDNSFWKALLGEVSPDLQRAFASVRVTERMKKYYREYNPCSYFTTKEGLKVHRYHFWEHIYAECQVLLSEGDCCEILNSLLNNEEWGWAPLLWPAAMWKMLEFPFVSLFLAARFPKFRAFVVDTDSALYNYLESWPKSRDWEFSRGSYFVMKRILEEGDVSLSIKSVALNRVLSHSTGTVQSLTFLLEDKEVKTVTYPKWINLDGVESEDIMLYLLQNKLTADVVEPEELLYKACVKHWEKLVSWLLPRCSDRVSSYNLFSKALGYGKGTDQILVMFMEGIDPGHLEAPHIWALLKMTSPITLRKLLEAHTNAFRGAVASLASEMSTYDLRVPYNTGHKEQLFILLESKALDITSKDRMRVWANKKGHSDVIDVLRPFRDSNVRSHNYVPLLIAWEEKRLADCETFLDRRMMGRHLESFVCSLAEAHEDLALFILAKVERDGRYNLSIASSITDVVKKVEHRVDISGIQKIDYTYPLLNDAFLSFYDAETLTIVAKLYMEGRLCIEEVDRINNALVRKGAFCNNMIGDMIADKSLVRHKVISFLTSLIRCENFDPSYEDSRILDILCESDTPELLEAIVADPRVNTGAYESSALFLAAKHNMRDLVRKLLLDPRVNPEDADSASFQVACRFGDCELVELFLRDGRADPTARSSLALINAVYARKVGIVALLVTDKRYCVGGETAGNCGCSNICPWARNELARKIATYNDDRHITMRIGRPHWR